jgi:hypothetical protein
MTTAAEVPDDLRHLALAYPDWEFGSGWYDGASGPGFRTVWARQPGVTLTAHGPTGLSEQLAQWTRATP